MKLKNVSVGIAVTGSFCTYKTLFEQLELLIKEGADVYPIFSYHAQSLDTRFGRAGEFLKQMEYLTGHQVIQTIPEAEPIGPNGYLDILIIMPCTGNTLAKLAGGIADTPALMAAKAHLRNEKPLLLYLSTNDALGMNMKNIGTLMSSKDIYFIPFGQDDPVKKTHSMISDPAYLSDSLLAALKGRQYQPVIVSPLHTQ